MSPELTNTVITAVISVAAPTLIGLAGVGLALLRKKTGLQESQLVLQNESNLRDSLQSSLVTAAGLYIQGKHDEAVSYVINHSADAVDHFAFSPANISEMIVNKAAAWAGVANPTTKPVASTNA